MHLPLLVTAFLLTLAAPLAAVLAEVPRSGLPVLVLLPPWVDAPTLIQSAGGQVIGLPAPFATLAYSPDPDFPDRLNQAGALAVRDAAQVAKFCGVA